MILAPAGSDSKEPRILHALAVGRACTQQQATGSGSATTLARPAPAVVNFASIHSVSKLVYTSLQNVSTCIIRIKHCCVHVRLCLVPSIPDSSMLLLQQRCAAVATAVPVNALHYNRINKKPEGALLYCCTSNTTAVYRYRLLVRIQQQYEE